MKFSNFLSICKKFDEISDRCKEISDKTSELVELEEYVKNASTVRVLQLQNDVDGAAERLLFLLDYANLPCMFQFIFYHHLYCFVTAIFCHYHDYLLQPTNQYFA